jgi:hypothetical protein
MAPRHAIPRRPSPFMQYPPRPSKILFDHPLPDHLVKLLKGSRSHARGSFLPLRIPD